MLQSSRSTARLTSPGQLAASIPICLGFVPTESLVVMCCHEPRGRVGLTMRIDLPGPHDEQALVHEVARRVRQERATRVVLAVYTEEADRCGHPRAGLVAALRDQLHDLVVTEALLVRGQRFWSYLCSAPSCCPPQGTPVSVEAGSAALLLLDAERVWQGRSTLPDRAALEAALAGPALPAAAGARQRCERAVRRPPLDDAVWAEVVQRYAEPPADLTDDEAAGLAVSLTDRDLRDRLGATSLEASAPLLALLEELCRRTPAPYDAAVCTLYAWLAYQAGAGARVTIALERALRSDPDYRLALLLDQALLAQVPPERLRQVASHVQDTVTKPHPK